jgi:hypothetical protein
MASVNYQAARELLDQEYLKAEAHFLEKEPLPEIDKCLVEDTDALFDSKTQAFREVPLGCVLAKLVSPEIDLRYPYISLNQNAYSGRTLDEKVVNPFLQDHQIPSSKGPYLSVFRRSVPLLPETGQGIRDRKGYEAFLHLINHLQTATEGDLTNFLRYLLFRFVTLRETSSVSLSRVHRLSVRQYETLIDGLLKVPSGGLLPVLLSVAMFQTMRQCFDLEWEIEWQGINVADLPSGAGGDIIIRKSGIVFLVVEITERQIDRSRVVSTFNTKISPQGIEDYLFFFSSAPPSEEAHMAARKFFAQGHDISFLSVKEWLVNCLGTVGANCRRTFTDTFLGLLESSGSPVAIKVAWNEQIKALLE